jgi:hypothetical protein
MVPGDRPLHALSNAQMPLVAACCHSSGRPTSKPRRCDSQRQKAMASYQETVSRGRLGSDHRDFLGP